MKYHSLRHSLFFILMGFAVTMVALCVVILLLSGNLFSNVQRRMLDQHVFSDFFHQTDDIQQALFSQFTSEDSAEEEALLASLHALQSMADSLRGAFDSPQFTDLYYLTESYVKAVEDFLASKTEGEPSARLTAYYQAQHVHTLIAGQQRNLNAVMETAASESIAMFSRTWQRQLFIMIACVAVVSVALLLAGMRFVRRIISPITQLTRQAEEMARGNLNADMPIISHRREDETQVLIRSFMLMAATIRHQMRQLEEKITLSEELHALEMQNMQMQVSLSDTERLFMQSLINPHFLFNCLTTLSSLAYIEKAPKVREASGQIAHYLRQSLQRIGQEVTISQELDHIRGYIGIQRLRFAERIRFEVACGEDCETALLPAMVLQPLVENAVSHGVGAYLQGGEIFINIRRADGRIHLTVRDNGVGIPLERIDQIRTDLDTPFVTRKTGIGFRSVHSRMHAFFEDEMSYSIQSQPGQTVISFSFPFREQA